MSEKLKPKETTKDKPIVALLVTKIVQGKYKDTEAGKKERAADTKRIIEEIVSDPNSSHLLAWRGLFERYEKSCKYYKPANAAAVRGILAAITQRMEWGEYSSNVDTEKLAKGIMGFDHDGRWRYVYATAEQEGAIIEHVTKDPQKLTDWLQQYQFALRKETDMSSYTQKQVERVVGAIEGEIQRIDEERRRAAIKAGKAIQEASQAFDSW